MSRVAGEIFFQHGAMNLAGDRLDRGTGLQELDHLGVLVGLGVGDGEVRLSGTTVSVRC